MAKPKSTAQPPVPIAIGASAPDFKLPDRRGRVHRLKDYRGRFIVLYFYPEDDTPLCTTQACQFRASHSDFEKLNAVVLGISPDDAASHAAFTAKFNLPFTLLADIKDDSGNPPVSTLYGAWGEKNMYGNLIRGMLRTTYLIDPAGVVVKRWDRVKTPRHGETVLAALRELATGGQSVPTSPTPRKKN